MSCLLMATIVAGCNQESGHAVVASRTPAQQGGMASQAVGEVSRAYAVVSQKKSSSSRMFAIDAAHLSVPKELAVDLGSHVKLDFLLILPGEFMMGSSESVKNAPSNQKPQHKVQITQPFYLGKYLVTQEQWRTVMHDNPSCFRGPKNPVERVSWDDCQMFLDKLNAQHPMGRAKFCFPTEAQWEYACRAGSTTIFSFGDDPSKLGDYGWYVVNAQRTTHPVGERLPNAWGLYDMHGNVYQWCEDWFEPDFYRNSLTDDPQGVADPTGPATGKYHVTRGGDWFYGPEVCWSAARGSRPPLANNGVGFRVALTPADGVPHKGQHLAHATGRAGIFAELAD